MVALGLCLKNGRFLFTAMLHETSDLMKDALLGPVKKAVFPLASDNSLIHIFSPSPVCTPSSISS